MKGCSFGTISDYRLTCLSAAPQPDLLLMSGVTKARLSALLLHLWAGNCIIFMNDISVTFMACQEVFKTHLIKTATFSYWPWRADQILSLRNYRLFPSLRLVKTSFEIKDLLLLTDWTAFECCWLICISDSRNRRNMISVFS